MRISKLRRVGSGLLAAVIAMSMYVGAALPAAAAAVGDDGSAEMNEANADRSVVQCEHASGMDAGIRSGRPLQQSERRAYRSDRRVCRKPESQSGGKANAMLPCELGA